METEHTPPTAAERIAYEAVAKLYGGEPFPCEGCADRIGCHCKIEADAMLAALRSEGLLRPDTPDAELPGMWETADLIGGATDFDPPTDDGRERLVRWLKARFHGGESCYEPAYDDADAILQLLGGLAVRKESNSE